MAAGDEFFQTPGNEVGDDRFAWGGQGRRTDADGFYIPGSSGAEQDVQRYRSMADGAQYNPAPQLNRDEMNQSRGYQTASRGYQTDAVGLARDAAYGGQPSRAEIYGQHLIDDSIDAQLAGAAAARGGPAASAAAARNAANQAAVMRQRGSSDLAAMRADEMARARDSYLAGSSALREGDATMRGQDYQTAATDAQLRMQQSGLNQQDRQFNEQLGWNTRKQQQDAELQRQAIDNMGWYQGRKAKMEDEQNEREWYMSLANGVGGVLGGIFSDVRAKEDVYPIGPTGPGGIIRQNPFGEAPAASASPFVRQNPYGAAPAAAAPSPGGLASDSFMSRFGAGMGGMHFGPNMAYRPFPSDARAKYIVSDERAKREAFVEGANYAELNRNIRPESGGQQTPLPKYMQTAPGEEKQMIWHRDQLPQAQRMNRADRPPAEPREMKSFQRDAPTPRDVSPVDRDYRPAVDRHRSVGQHPSYGPEQDGPLASAARSMAPSAYTYKPGFVPPEQQPGEMNVGPMAQNMAQDSLASTAVKQDPGSGLYMLDPAKLEKLNSAINADQQRQLDELRRRTA